jgi:hypothetical protein
LLNRHSRRRKRSNLLRGSWDRGSWYLGAHRLDVSWRSGVLLPPCLLSPQLLLEFVNFFLLRSQRIFY